jgi:ribosomal protein L14E/L6E/L27E
MEGQKIKDILRFKKELYFNGAVQIDWFYHNEKQMEVAKSFVFHGPEYFGVSEEDITYKSHKLVDTASFTKFIANKLYGETNGSNFIMTIAPYGTGKSHLAVTLASLFGNKVGNNTNDIIFNLQKVDKKIGQEVYSLIGKPNIVLVLNGMKDFNLNYEILNATQKVLDIHKVDGSFLKTLTKSYDIAENFVKNTFDTFQKLYESSAKDLLPQIPVSTLKEYLIQNILQDTNVFEVINTVYHHVNGTYIRWDEGVSAGDVLLKISQTLCGDREQFNKVLVLFDEFGRYIEFASSYPTRAGDSALQQIYEAVQDSGDKILFVGFIQSDLKSYLTRVDRSSNINRYVGRYEASDKIHLSSNLETIFANLIERTNSDAFKELIESKLNKDDEINKWKMFHNKLMSWLPSAQDSSVWKDFNHFRKVILEGIYPLHPLTTWMLSNLSSWLQQRSSLTFLEKQIENFGHRKLNVFGDLPLIPAIAIIQSDFFQELLAAEQDERKQSEYCILYNQILIKYGDKLDDLQKSVLAANLILRIGRFKTKSLEDVKAALVYTSCLTVKQVEEAVFSLENEFGVLSYDDIANVYDFVADATGINDFKRLIQRKKNKIELDLKLVFQSSSKELLSLDNIENSFAQRNFVVSNEWKFTQHLMHIDEINNEFLLSLKNEWDLSTKPEVPKGKIIWLYLPKGVDDKKILSVQNLLKKQDYSKLPILFFVLDDKEESFYNVLLDYQVSKLFTEEERIKYARFIPDFISKNEMLVKDRFNNLASQRLEITKDRIVKVNQRLNKYTEEVFERLYPDIIPFPFTGFTGKSLTKPKQALSRMARLILAGMNYQIIHSETTEMKNRIEEVLFEGKVGAWGVLNNNYQLITPTNMKVRKIFNNFDLELEENNNLAIHKIFDIYQKPPYGLNDYALALIIAVYLAQRRIETRVSIQNSRLRLEEWAKEIYLDKEIKLLTLLDSTITKVNVDELSTRYLNFSMKVERNNDVDLCPILKMELEQLKKEEDIPEEIADKVGHMEMILDIGLDLYEKTKKMIGEVRAKYEHAKDEKDIKKIFEVIESCEKINGPIEGSNRYVYNIKHLEIAKNIIDGSHAFVEKEFNEWLKKLKCQNVGQVTLFEKWVKDIIKFLNKYNYTEEARKTRTKLDKILDDLSVIQKLQNINGTVQDYLRKSVPSENSGFDELHQLKREGQELIDFILSHNVDRDYLDSYLDKLEPRVELISLYIDKLTEQITQVYDAFFDLTDISMTQETLKLAKTLLGRNLKKEDRINIEQSANDLQNFLNDVERIEDLKENRNELLAELEVLEKKWSNYESDIEFIPLINSYKENTINHINNLESKWENKYLKNLNDPNSWDVNECNTWLNDTKVFPHYLSHGTIENYKKMQVKVMNRLNELSVDGVISLFNNLTVEQQKICYDKIVAIVNNK